MKKKLLITLLAAALLLCGVSAYGSNSDSDSLISVSYLTETILPSLKKTFASRAAEGTKHTADQAAKQLEEQGNAFMAALGKDEDAGNWLHSETISTLNVKRGDQIILSTGSSLLWTSGTASASAGLVDATAGAEQGAGANLSQNHRYISGVEDGTVTVTVLSDRAAAAVQGAWMLEESGESVTSFHDLNQSKDWFYNAVRYVVDQGLFNGITTEKFAPNTTMDRSMLATVLHRMEGTPAQEYQGTFRDVKAGQWYTPGVEWAAAQKIVNGTGDGTTFSPAVSITREQIAAMLFRYAGEYLGLDVTLRGDLTAYSDHEKVSGWAEEAMAWAVGSGIISGADGGTLMPGKSATRAEVATMLQRFQNNLNP